MAAPQVTPLPPPPNAQTAAGEFSNQADEFLGAFPTLAAQINVVANFMNDAAEASQHAIPASITAQEAAQTAQAAAAAAQSSAGLPAMAGRGRRPLAVNREGTGVLYSDTLSIANYIDRSVRNNAATGTVTLNLSAASIFDLTLAGSVTLAVAGVPALAGETLSIVVRIRQGSTQRTVTWWPGITWLASGGEPRSVDAGKIGEFVLSFDGTDWIGRQGARS